jgi:malate synthase
VTDPEVRGPVRGRAEEVLTEEALRFLGELHRRFDPTRRALLAGRSVRQEALDKGELPDLLPETKEIREGDWRVAEAPPDLRDRRVEITGPTDRKMIINALNSGARVFMADFEDANAPTWANMVEGQVNLLDAVRGTITHEEDGKSYELAADTATLVVRPRGWHLPEPRVVVDGEPMAGSLFDAGLYLYHNARELRERGTGPYFYLAKLEGHREARLWNEVFVFAQDRLGIPRGSVRATVLIETITAAFEMEEILYELREHSGGLNAGRWDYIFSVIKRLRAHPRFLLPDRAEVTMGVPFMRAYAEALVRACHRRGAHAIGGMSAFIPSRRDPEINAEALPRVRADKQRECDQGFDGAWVAHPDLVPEVREIFDRALGDRPNQLDRLREDVYVTASDLLDVSIPDGRVTEEGLRTNVSVGILYLDSWLRGTGAAALFNLMEDTATAEISRSQVWQWVQHGASVEDGHVIDRELVAKVIDEELEKIEDFFGTEQFASMRFDDARELFERVALAEEMVEFLTVPGMEYMDDAGS